MAFCKYCGTQYPDGGACTNPACIGANQAPAVNPSVNPFAPQGEPSSQPPKKSSKGVFIALALVVVLIIAAVVVLVLLLSNKKKEDEKKKKVDSPKGAIETYVENYYNNKKGFDDYMKVKMPDDVFNEYKKTDKYDYDKNRYKESFNYSDSKLKFSLGKVMKTDKLSEDELNAAEEYFYEMACEYGIDIDEDFEVTKGYEYMYELEIKRSSGKEVEEKIVCVVNVKGDGWKFINLEAYELEDDYGD